MTAYICAWCKKGLGEGGERLENELLLIAGDPVSRGICGECEEKLEAGGITDPVIEEVGPIVRILQGKLRERGL